MKEIRSKHYKWSKSWIDFKAPNAQGVYSIQDKVGKVIFVGKGNIRQRLLSHWNRQDCTDAVVWACNPYSFRFELSEHPDDREAELTRDLKPICRQMSNSKFKKHW